MQDRYDFECANCGHEMQAAPSIAMTDFGINTGGGRCSKCSTYLHLEIEGYPDGTKMKSQKHEDYLASRNKQA